jgi:K+-sensing histidine kinase KdpD
MNGEDEYYRAARRYMVEQQLLDRDIRDPRVLQAMGSVPRHLFIPLEHRRLAAEAAQAGALAEANALRTALLQAVSHDLRTPLASIKASATSLTQDDVEWSKDETREFLATITEETDRLTALVGNLLDMSRIQAGAVQPDGPLPSPVAGEKLDAVAGAKPLEVEEAPEPLKAQVSGERRKARLRARS